MYADDTTVFYLFHCQVVCFSFQKKDVMQYTVQLVSAAFTLSGHKPEQYGSLLLSACELSVEKESYRWMSEICLGET